MSGFSSYREVWTAMDYCTHYIFKLVGNMMNRDDNDRMKIIVN